MAKTTNEPKYEKWGNNEWHNPAICENCEYNTCETCSNGFRGEAYQRAIAEERLKDMQYEISQWNGLDDE